MTKELKKRIITSIILFIAAILCIVINEVIFIFAILIVFARSFHEWNDINLPYFFIKKKNRGEFVFVLLAGLAYLFIFLYSAVFIYKVLGSTFFVFILCICVCSDIGGYILGKTVGGKKLTKISPNKTISGSIGSFIFSLTPLLLFNYDLILKNLLFCLIVSFSCQLGDLIISYFKRLNRVKDTGNILPGHGGLLDRIDGIIFAIPTIYILKNYFGIF